VRKLIELDAKISDVFAEQILEEELKVPVSVKFFLKIFLFPLNSRKVFNQYQIILHSF